MAETKPVTSFVINSVRLNDDRSIVVLVTVTFSDTSVQNLEFSANTLKAN